MALSILCCVKSAFCQEIVQQWQTLFAFLEGVVGYLYLLQLSNLGEFEKFS